MKHLFLTSSIGTPGVAESILAKLGNHKFQKTAYLTTAVECEPEEIGQDWDDSDHDAVKSFSNEMFDYSISNKTDAKIKEDLKDIDCVFIAGGNTFYLLQESEKCNFKKVVHELVDRGVVYIGCSAGSIIAGPDLSPILGIDDVKKAPTINGYAGFALVNFTILAHWGSSEFRTEWLSSKSFGHMYKTSPSLIALNNYEYIEVQDDKFRIIDVRGEK